MPQERHCFRERIVHRVGGEGGLWLWGRLCARTLEVQDAEQMLTLAEILGSAEDVGINAWPSFLLRNVTKGKILDRWQC